MRNSTRIGMLPEWQRLHRESGFVRRLLVLCYLCAVLLAGLACTGAEKNTGAQNATTPADETPTSSQTPVATGPTIAPDGADRVGLVGLAPEGATPSSPKRGEPVLGFHGIEMQILQDAARNLADHAAVVDDQAFLHDISPARIASIVRCRR